MSSPHNLVRLGVLGAALALPGTVAAQCGSNGSRGGPTPQFSGGGPGQPRNGPGQPGHPYQGVPMQGRQQHFSLTPSVQSPPPTPLGPPGVPYQGLEQQLLLTRQREWTQQFLLQRQRLADRQTLIRQQQLLQLALNPPRRPRPAVPLPEQPGDFTDSLELSRRRAAEALAAPVVAETLRADPIASPAPPAP